MIHLYVWLRPPNDRPFIVGELLVSGPDNRRGGRLQGEFRYDPKFLARKDAFALDPLHLPLVPEPLPTDNPRTGIHSVFEDSLPDAWGWAILRRRYDIPRSRQRPAELLGLLGAEAMGALAYTENDRWEEVNNSAGLPELADLAVAVKRYERDPGGPMDELMRLFRAGSSPGGARPKVLVRDDQNIHWLAKLSSIRDSYDMVHLEAASLATAREGGVLVPEFRVEELGRQAALLVRRFDVTPEGGRNHMVSLQTLLGAQDYYHLGYRDMADIVRRVTDAPARDLSQLFRQAVFNALLGNTDDHLKNFAMLHGKAGWGLSPAFDLLPDVNDNREHVLHFGAMGTRPSIHALYDLGKAFGLSKRITERTIEELQMAVEQFPEQCDKYRVPAADQKALSRRVLAILER